MATGRSRYHHRCSTDGSCYSCIVVTAVCTISRFAPSAAVAWSSYLRVAGPQALCDSIIPKDQPGSLGAGDCTRDPSTPKGHLSVYSNPYVQSPSFMSKLIITDAVCLPQCLQQFTQTSVTQAISIKPGFHYPS